MWVHICLTCLFYYGAVSKNFSIRNTGKLLFYRGRFGWVWWETESRLMDVSGRSTRDQGLLHLPQEQEGGATSHQDVHCQEICSSVWGQFLFIITTHRLARSVSDYFVTVWERLAVCFHSSFFLRLVLHFNCFRTVCLQYGEGWRCYCITIHPLLDWKALYSQDTSFRPMLILKH